VTDSCSLSSNIVFIHAYTSIIPQITAIADFEQLQKVLFFNIFFLIRICAFKEVVPTLNCVMNFRKQACLFVCH